MFKGICLGLIILLPTERVMAIEEPTYAILEIFKNLEL